MKFIVQVLISLMVLHPAGEADITTEGGEIGCEVEALQLSESTALLVLSHAPSIVDRKINKKSDSLLLQLYLWAALEGDRMAIKRIGRIGVDNILDRDDNSLNRLLWILAQNNDPLGEYSSISFTQADLDVLNKWANREVQRNPRNVFNAMASKSGRFGGESPSLLEFKNIDIKIRDPEALFHMAGLRSSKDEYMEAYELLKESATGGEWRAFLGLAIIEKSKFKNCGERAQTSYRIFSSLQNSGVNHVTD